MKFEEIAEILSEQENKRVSVFAVRLVYYKALNKLKKKVQEDPELEKKLRELITEDPGEQALINEILNSMVELDY